MPFHALERSLEVIECLREVVGRVRSRDPKLCEEIRTAASSMSLNLAEGRRRFGRDRVHFFRIAAGSADEVRASLRVACAWGYLNPGEIAGAQAKLDEVLAMLWRLTNRGS